MHATSGRIMQNDKTTIHSSTAESNIAMVRASRLSADSKVFNNLLKRNASYDAIANADGASLLFT